MEWWSGGVMGLRQSITPILHHSITPHPRSRQEFALPLHQFRRRRITAAREFPQHRPARDERRIHVEFLGALIAATFDLEAATLLGLGRARAAAFGMTRPLILRHGNPLPHRIKQSTTTTVGQMAGDF